ncbi:MAG TPA: DUF3347 domain-containing protein [Flavisolibacter sp.]|jgi:hypothetical protein|nr:DUF3347 domain-containing protein [Flavisolibacter sp.]
MKQVRKASFALTVAISLVACGNNETKKTEDHSQHQTTNEKEQAAQTGPVRIQDEQLNAVYQHYIHLSTALANSDMAEAKAASNAIEAGTKDLQNASKIASAAAKITAAKDIEEQRVAYEALSSEMISRVKTAGVNNGEVYVQHCPMAFNDKGANWLSSTKEIRNPYFGNKMLTCGETKETIK